MGQNIRQYEITVLTGLNAGVELPMPSGRHTIGGAETDDIQLDGVTETLADFALEQGVIKLKPRVSTLSAKPDGALAQDRVKTLNLPARISLTNEIDIFAERVAQDAPKRKLMKPVLAIASVLAAALVLTAVQVDFKPTQATASAPMMEHVNRPDPRVPLVVVQSAEPSSSCTDCAADAASDLRQNLINAGILGLSVVSSGGAVRVDGGLSVENRAKWGQIRSGFDGKWAMVPLLTSFTESKNGAPISVASVWLGETREVRTDGGETITIGEKTADGWMLTAIEEEYVELVLGETKLRVTY